MSHQASRNSLLPQSLVPCWVCLWPHRNRNFPRAWLKRTRWAGILWSISRINNRNHFCCSLDSSLNMERMHRMGSTESIESTEIKDMNDLDYKYSTRYIQSYWVLDDHEDGHERRLALMTMCNATHKWQERWRECLEVFEGGIGGWLRMTFRSVPYFYSYLDDLLYFNFCPLLYLCYWQSQRLLMLSKHLLSFVRSFLS